MAKKMLGKVRNAAQQKAVMPAQTLKHQRKLQQGQETAQGKVQTAQKHSLNEQKSTAKKQWIFVKYG